jgi:glyoxalase-like protein
MAVTGLDHIIYAAPDLERGIEEIRALTGVEPVRGGSHPGRGTRNALLSLGQATYIEILAPDPSQPAEARARAAERIPATARIIGWAAKCDDLEGAVSKASSRGLDLGRIESMSRTLPSGEQLAWRLTRGDSPGDGLVPFLIDWGESQHPALSAPSGCSLKYLRAEHPDPARIKNYVALLALHDVLEVTQGPVPRIFAGLSSPNGLIVIE